VTLAACRDVRFAEGTILAYGASIADLAAMTIYGVSRLFVVLPPVLPN
jgi:hypothetical protein